MMTTICGSFTYVENIDVCAMFVLHSEIDKGNIIAVVCPTGLHLHNVFDTVFILKGSFVHSFKFKMIFEVKEVVSTVQNCALILEGGAWCTGSICAISAKLNLSSMSDVVFIDLITAQDKHIVLFVTKSALKLRPYICIGDELSFIKTAKRIKWKDNVSYSAGCGAHICQTYMVDKVEQLQCRPNTGFLPSNRVFLDAAAAGEGLFSGSRSVADRERLSRTECIVEGTVIRLHRWGWVHLNIVFCSVDCGATEQHVSLLLYVSQLKFLDHILDSVRPGAVLRGYNVLPVFLRGLLRGFACTVRSSVEIVKFAPVSSSASRLPVLSIPHELRDCCTMYAAWKADAYHRLAALGEFAGGDKHFSLLQSVLAALECCTTFAPSIRAAGDTMSSEELRQFLRVPFRSVPIQEGFRDCAVAELFAVRAGQDADFLSRHLPKVLTCAQLRRLAERFVRQRIDLEGVCEKHSFDSHCLDLAALVGGVSECKCSQNCVVVGSVRSESVKSYKDGAVWLNVTDRSCSSFIAVFSNPTRAFLEFWRQGFTCQPLVLVARGRLDCWLVQEDPQHDEQSCKLVLVLNERDVCLLAANAEWTGWDRPPAPLSASPASGSKDSSPSVREALMADVTPKVRERPVSVQGVVVGKVVCVDAYKTVQAKSQRTEHRQSSGFSAPVTEKRCKVLLRDRHFADYIVAYLPLSQTEDLFAGSVLRVTGAVVRLPEGNKKPYLNCASASVDVVGCVSAAELRLICQDMPHLLNTPRHIPTSLLSRIPKSSLQQIAASSSHNRCMWAVTGHVTFVRKILVSLRCSKCLVLAALFRDEFTCARCNSRAFLHCLWESSVALDDGTAECDLHLEGADALKVLRSRYDRDGNALTKIAHLVDQAVRRRGRFVYDPKVLWSQQYQMVGGQKSGSAEIDLDDLEGLADSLFALPTVVPPSADWQRDSESSLIQTLRSYLQSCRFSVPFRVCCTVSAGNASSGGDAGGTRRISLQEVNSDFRYRAVFSAMPSHAAKRLSLEGCEVTELGGEEMRLSAWEMVNQLSR